MSETLKKLIQYAKKVRLNAHAPYSNFFVGSSILDENNNIHIGCNVENSAYPSGSCAEEQAIGAMCASGSKKIKEIVIIGRSDVPVTPCGACRQRIREFSDENTLIHIYDTEKGHQKTYTIKQILPDSFGPENL